MKQIDGIQIPGLPYPPLELVGVLLFTVYPSTIVYKHQDNYPVLKEWVDCSEDNKTDRYFYYIVDKLYLKQFIDSSISHADLISKSFEGKVYFQDEKEGQVLNTVLVSVDSIPNDYLPKSEFVFRKEEGVDTDLIINTFDLEDYTEDNNILPFEVKMIAKKENSEAMYVRLQKGRGIGHGTVRTYILGSTLLCIDKLYKSVALDHLRGKDRGEIILDAKKNEPYWEYTDTEIFGQSIAASYGIMLRPINKHLIDVFDMTPAYQIAEKTINLITKTQQPDGLKDEYQLHSKFTLVLYEQFLNEVYKQELKIGFNWYNPKNSREISTNIDYRIANKVIEEIKQLYISNEIDIPLTGKFREIDCETAHFIFKSTNGEKYTGYFNDNIKETINQINFMDVYKITIKRTIEKKPGKEDRASDVITVCYLDK